MPRRRKECQRDTRAAKGKNRGGQKEVKGRPKEGQRKAREAKPGQRLKQAQTRPGRFVVICGKKEQHFIRDACERVTAESDKPGFRRLPQE